MRNTRSLLAPGLTCALLSAVLSTGTSSALAADGPEHEAGNKTIIVNNGSHNNIGGRDNLVGSGHTAGTGHTVSSGATGGVEDTDEVRLRVLRQSLRGLQTIPIPGFLCPTDHPWLVGQNYSGGENVPRGVEVVQAGANIAVAIEEQQPVLEGLATGWTGSSLHSATNWDVRTHALELWAHCTSDASRGYNPGQG
ncbi:hypothetical protein [Streptomyces sp. NPDC057939]|uniref:hypothetical protein n=1 Tax=Streptomyces sp. NPDC057939 TaxID=3346284 RepID=UPI0036E428F9